jgi:F0F1-type ATP synthase assembly protein I
VSGECVKCPNVAWLLPAIFIGGILVLVVLGWILNRKRVNMAFLSIGVDYFQVRGWV